jgi:hypothetical protein
MNDINAQKLEVILNRIIDQQNQINSMDEKIKELDEQLRLLVDLFHEDQYARTKEKGLLN